MFFSAMPRLKNRSGGRGAANIPGAVGVGEMAVSTRSRIAGVGDIREFLAEDERRHRGVRGAA